VVQGIATSGEGGVVVMIRVALGSVRSWHKDLDGTSSMGNILGADEVYIMSMVLR